MSLSTCIARTTQLRKKKSQDLKRAGALVEADELMKGHKSALEGLIESLGGEQRIEELSKDDAKAFNELSDDDKQTVYRARKIQRFLSHPMHVSEVFSGIPGVYVSLAETVRGFREILEGRHDDKPESAFYNKGGIDTVKAD